MTFLSLTDSFRSANTLEKKNLIALIEKAMGHYLECWRQHDNECGFFGELDPTEFNMKNIKFSSPVIEYVIKPHCQVLACITALINAESNGDISLSNRQDLVTKLNFGINWACRTHLTGDTDVAQFLGRRRWGENWNSSQWASVLAISAFFGRDYLNPEVLKKVNTVASFEADRFVDTLPPNGRRGDSKAEETARDTMILAWAISLMPEHVNVKKWKDTLKVYALNIASTAYDHGEFHNLDGRKISSYISTVTMHPDFTLESHGFFHPEFLAYTQYVMGAVLSFIATNQAVPDYLIRPSHDKASQLFISCCLSNGYPWPVGGQDWPLWMLNPYCFAYSMWRDDRIALKTLLNHLSLLAEFQEKNGDGRFIPGLPASKGGWALNFETQIGSELALLYFTPFSKDLVSPVPGRFERAQDINEKFSYVQTLIRRNSKTFRSFTWNNLTGLPTACMVPQSLPMIAGVSANNLIGTIEAEGDKLEPVVQFHQEQSYKEGFETSGKMVYNTASGIPKLERELRVFTWDDDGMLLFDKLTAVDEITINREEACPFYLVNDDITGGRINIISGSLEETICGDTETAQDHVMPNPWVVVEDLITYQLFWGLEKGIVYRDETQKNEPPYWKNLRMDRVLIRGKPGKYSPGEVIRQFGLYVGLGKTPKWFKVNGNAGEFFKGLILIEGKNTLAL